MSCKSPLLVFLSLAHGHTLALALVSPNLFPFHILAVSIWSDEVSSHHKLSWTAIHSHPWLHTFAHIQEQAHNVGPKSIGWSRRQRIMWKESTCLIYFVKMDLIRENDC